MFLCRRYEGSGGMVEYQLPNAVLYILVFVRMGAMLFFNPILSRKNIQARFRIALVLGLTLLIAPNLNTDALKVNTDIELVIAIIYEIMLGVVFNFVFQFFYYMLFLAGDLLDFQFGLSMAKVFDPGTSIQMSISGTWLNILFMLYFFSTNSHLVFIQLMASSYTILPVGSTQFSGDVSEYMVQLFILIFTMIMKLVVPFVAMEFIIEISMGILMKLIPQIHVFVINIQFKILLAFTMLFLLAEPISDFLDGYIISALNSAQQMLNVIASG